jgi:hypothetical protein
MFMTARLCAPQLRSVLTPLAREAAFSSAAAGVRAKARALIRQVEIETLALFEESLRRV